MGMDTMIDERGQVGPLRLECGLEALDAERPGQQRLARSDDERGREVLAPCRQEVEQEHDRKGRQR